MWRMGGIFAGEAYASRNFRIAKIRARDERRNRLNRTGAPIEDTEIGDFQLAYDVRKEHKWPSHKPTRPIKPVPGLESVQEETDPTRA